MRIRSIKPEFWRSDDVASLSWEHRLVFVGLWSYVDDNGVGDARVASIAADLFAADLSADTAQTLSRVKDALSELEARGMIRLYRAEGRALLFVSAWERHQLVRQPSAGHKYPLPSGDSFEPLQPPAQTLRGLSADTAQTLITGTGEQGNRGTGDSLSPGEPADPNTDWPAAKEEPDPSAGILIPEDWRPQQSHVDKARSLHLDVVQEYQRFRAHAERTQRRLRSWNTGFTNWLRKSAEMNQQRSGRPSPGPRSFGQQRQDNALSLVAAYEREEAGHAEVGDGEGAGVRALGAGR